MKYFAVGVEVARKLPEASVAINPHDMEGMENEDAVPEKVPESVPDTVALLIDPPVIEGEVITVLVS